MKDLEVKWADYVHTFARLQGTLRLLSIYFFPDRLFIFSA